MSEATFVRRVFFLVHVCLFDLRLITSLSCLWLLTYRQHFIKIYIYLYV